jgi:hypothetical protein
MNKLVLVILLVFAIACKKTVIVGFHDKPVVEAYLFADSIPVVKISKLVPFDSTMRFSNMVLTQLKVTINDLSSGKSYLLASLGDGTYKSQDLIVAEGSTYQLSFPYNGLQVTASTTVPPKPQNVKFSALSLSISQTGEPGTGGSFEPPVMTTPVEVTWSNSDQGYYLLVVKNLETNKVTINIRNNFSGDFSQSQPSISSEARLNPQSFKYYGSHLVSLLRIQPEYVLFFQQTSNSSLSLTEINANIVNGYGIFTALNAYSANFYVNKL